MAEVNADGSGNTGQTTVGERRRKLTPSEAGFKADNGIPGYRCGDCLFYENGDCRIVQVQPDADDVCEQFEPDRKGNLKSSNPGLGTEIRRQYMYVTRVSTDRQTGKRQWFATASGIKKDLYQERMSVPLFKDFITRIESRDEVPEPFSSKAWNGGLPYLGVAHYLDQDGNAIAGDTEQIWIDGDYLKARGTFKDNDLGRAAYAAVKRDIDENVPYDERVRISIAFLDWGHEHKGFGVFKRKSLMNKCPMCARGINEKVYQAGQLVHLALTRRPAYPETEIILEERSMGESNRYDDAASVVGDEQAEKLEKRAQEMVMRSDDGEFAEEALVTKQDDDEVVIIEEEGEEEEGMATGTAEEGEAEGGMMAEGEEDVYRSYGGAKTIDDAESFLVREAPQGTLMDSWALLSGVLTNIAGAENAHLVNRAVSDFQDKIDILALKAITDVRDMLRDRVSERADDLPLSEKPSIDTGTAVGEHPLDEEMVSVRTAFDQALMTPVDEQSKLEMIQPALNSLGEAIMNNVAQPEQVTKSAPEHETADIDDLQQIVQQAIAPLAQSVAALEARVSAGSGDGKQDEVPVRRSIQGANPYMNTDLTPKKKSSLRETIRRSVGLGG